MLFLTSCRVVFTLFRGQALTAVKGRKNRDRSQCETDFEANSREAVLMKTVLSLPLAQKNVPISRLIKRL